MFSFSGHIREEDDFAIGDEWGSNPCGEVDTTLPQAQEEHFRQPRKTNSKRIDMAAMINENYYNRYEANEKDIEASELDKTVITREDSLTGSDKSYDEDRPFWKDLCCTLSPCAGRIVISSFIVLLMFCFGLGVGLATKNKGSTDSSFAAAQGAGDNAVVPPGTATVAPSTKPTNAPEPTLEPTALTDWDLDYEEWFQTETDLGEPVTATPVSNTVTQAPVAAPTPTANGDNLFDGNQGSNQTPVQEPPSDNVADPWGTKDSPYLVGVYYYPWHGDNFHNRDGYIRKDLSPRHQPTLGEYDDSEPETIAQHMRWSQQANIGLWITSWWGPNRVEDTNTKNVILNSPELGDLKVALHYETTGRVKDDVAAGLVNVRDDMEYICETYFDHPNYYKIDGRPVIFVYVTRKLEDEGNLESVVLTMRSSASKCGHDVFLVGDHVFAEAPAPNEVFRPFWYFDAVTNYDVYGSMGRPSPYAGRDNVDNYYNEQAQWRESAFANDCRYIPAVSPGYNDRGVRFEADHPPLSRKLTESSSEGSLFAYQLNKAKPLVDSEMGNLLVVNSFNEWHEDTQIEPAVGDRTNLPNELTQGVYYEGYGDLYLELLRMSTIEA